MEKLRIRCTQPPEDVLNALLDGEVLEVNGHRIEYDPADGVTWYTNPYGIDGVLCHVPSIESVTVFLERMASGAVFGLVPE